MHIAARQTARTRAILASFTLIAGLAAGAASALADEPGGVTKIPPPKGGEQVYTQICQSCHMADGKGGAGAATIPALAGDPRLAVAALPIITVAKGRGAMPWFDDMLTPTQIADVVVYVRTHFGNAYPAPVTAADVTRIAGPKTSP
jgi:mono/diheme cytochrome c family protein